MRIRWLAALVVAFLASGVASAQPNTGPTIEVKLRSVNDLVDKFEYVAGLAGKEDAVKQVRELLKMFTTEGKGIEGIDPKKPIGAYATLNKEIETSPFVVMIPIADQDQFIEALKTRLTITPEKGENGTLKVAVPIINELHLRFANGYLYVSQKSKDLDAKTILTPKAFFAQDDGSVASVLVHIDRIPADLRTFVFGQFEMGLNEERKKNAGNETTAEKKLKNLVFDTIIGGTKGILDDGKDLSVKLFADAKTDELSAEITLSARSGSPTAKNFTALGGKTSVPAGIVAAAGASVAHGNVKLAVTDGAKSEFASAVDGLLADLVKNAKPQEEEMVKRVVDAVGPTLKAGELDAAMALVGPDSKRRYQVIGAVAVKEGKGIEKLMKDLSPFAGEHAEFKFDIETIGDFTLHSVTPAEKDEKFEKLFGTKTIWLAVSDKYIAFSIEPDGATIRKGLKAKAAPVPAISGEVSIAKLVPLIHPDLKPDELKALLKDAFGDGSMTGKDAATFSVEGGDKLTVKFKMKGKAIRLFAGVSALKGK